MTLTQLLVYRNTVTDYGFLSTPSSIFITNSKSSLSVPHTNTKNSAESSTANSDASDDHMYRNARAVGAKQWLSEFFNIPKTRTVSHAAAGSAMAIRFEDVLDKCLGLLEGIE